ncbi:MAG: DUF2971 domain-containing protein [Burkholderiales bacterium]
MRTFHFLSEQHALQALQNQRLKAARYADLNDPFELLACDLSDQRARRMFSAWKDQTSKTMGLLCFSKRWKNPLLWSHYADRHRGVALEFEIDDDFVVPVRYSVKRMRLDLPLIMANGGFTGGLAEQIATTKSKHWAYEEEVRVPVSLSECIFKNGLYFEKLTEQVKIVGVVLGALSKMTSKEVRCVLPRGQRVTLQRSRMAFGSFSIVRNKAMSAEVIDGAS